MIKAKESSEDLGRAPAQPAFAKQLKDLIDRFGFFDPEWYLKTNPDVAAEKAAPLGHYLSSGYLENRSPHPFFEPHYYLACDPLLGESGLPAIEHYLLSGGGEGRPFHRAIDIKAYERFKRGAVHPMGAFIDLCTDVDAADAIALFSPEHYSKNTGQKGSPRDLFRHFLFSGIEQCADPHPLLRFKDLSKILPNFSPRELFFALVAGNGGPFAAQNVHPCFDAAYFRERYGEPNRHPLVEYLSRARNENIRPNAIFDPEFYRSQVGDENIKLDPLSHYLLTSDGDGDGGEPNPYFDTAWYRDQYADAFDEDEAPLSHYLKWGHTKWFSPGPRFAQRYYLTRSLGVSDGNENALAHFLDVGTVNGATPAPHAHFDRNTLRSESELFKIIRDAANEAPSSSPRVTVIIPAYKNIRHTLICLASIFQTNDATPFHVIVVDDCSPDLSGDRLTSELGGLDRVTIKQNVENLGFLRTCNHAVAEVDSDFVLLLNNDTTVLKGWLDELIETFEAEPKAGLVGSKLIYPNGLLQEAGGIVWAGGSAANYGRMDDPQAPQYNFRRDVDYISGAAIMVRLDAWKQVGGFSDEFAPAYYEDTDLAMKFREGGWRVVYQPLSEVIHHEGVTSGTDIDHGVKRFQKVNHEKFSAKWEPALSRSGIHGDFSRAVIDRQAKGRILIYDAATPTPDKDSGSVTAWNNCKILTDLGYRVTFLPANLALDGNYGRALQRIGVEVLFAPYIPSCREYIMDHASDYDLLICSRATTGGELLPAIKARHPNIPVIFDTVDVHYIRLMRQYATNGEHATLSDAVAMKKGELHAIGAADLTLLVSTFEAAELRSEIGNFPHAILPLIFAPWERRSPYADRADIAFVGGFRHPPNLDAVRYLMEEIWPAFRRRGVEAKLHIIGSHMPAEFHAYAAEDVVIAGFVPDIDEYLSRIRLTVAPLRYGAGVKGKVGNSLRLGAPVVATPIAAEGMGLVDGKHVLVADRPAAIADAMTRIYSDPALWEKMSRAGAEFVSERFGIGAATSLWRDITNNFMTRRKS